MELNPIFSLSLSTALTFVVTLALLFILRPLAIRLDLLDKPGGRKRHTGDIPLIGGIAIVFGFLVGLLTLSTSLINLRPYLLGLMILLVIGVLDDLHELTPKARLAAQLLVAIIAMTWGQTLLSNIGHIGLSGASHQLGWFAWVFTGIAIIGTINALNMLDGVDGQAAGVSLIALLTMLYLASNAHLTPEAMVMLLLSSATLAFACVNVPWWPKRRASAFMGDAGSMVLGFTLVYFALHLSQIPTQAFMPAAILWILIVPVSDIVYVTITRLLKKRSPLAAGRDHIHHLCLAYGFSPRQTLLLSLLLALFGAVMTILFTRYQWSDNLLFWLFIVWIFVYCSSVAFAWRRLISAKV